MIDDDVHRASPAAARGTPAELVRRLRRRLGWPDDPPLPRPQVEHLRPVVRTWLAAAWQARTAVQARLGLDEYLRGRLARYLAALPVPRARLPLAVEVRGGELLLQVLDPAPAAPPSGERGDGLATLVALEGPGARQEVAELEARLADLARQSGAARARVEGLRARLAADVSAGAVLAPNAVVATPEQLGRPPVRSAGGQTGLVAVAGTGILAEAWQLAFPLLRGAGIDPARLRAELAARPVEVLLTGGYALGIAVGLYALAHRALEAGAWYAREEGDPRRRRWAGAGAALGGLSAILVAAAAAALPGRAAAAPAWGAVCLLLAVPVGSALLLGRARREREARAATMAAALEWDRERARQLGDRARRQDEVALAEEWAREIERGREAARRRLAAIAQRARAAARLAAGAERRERLALGRLAQSLAAALERDRHAFVRQAAACGELELLAGRRKPAEPRPLPAPLEPAAEGGRLAG